MADATTESGLARFIDHWTIEFVRTYPHPIERVWRAIVDPHELGVWFIRPTVWEPVAGGAYRFHDDGFSGVIQQVDAPRVIRFGPRTDGGPSFGPGADAYFEFELEPTEGGTRLRYRQHADPAFPDPDEPDPDFAAPGRPGALAGWHAAFEELGFRLDGVRLRDRRMAPTRLSEIARDWAAMSMSDEFTDDQKRRILIGLRARERHRDYVDLYRDHVRATRPAKEA